MKVGDVVTWKSQAGGYSKVKTGKIVIVVPAGSRPSANMSGIGWGRRHESYVVKVGNKLYWPHVSALRLKAARRNREA